ncbi:MAG TPA: YgcG family protein, partial [Steroidobacteraceae bacterium]|nr:YgcG family protein [Steroidobacteraceae bacterium]
MIGLPCLRRLPAILAACLFALAASGQVAVPPLTARVTDLTGTLSGAAVQRIETKLGDLEAKKGSQIAVLILPTTQPEEIEQFGIRVMDQWKVGRKGIDDGAILIVAKDDRRVRIEVGYGLEGALPDAIAKRIIDETITPLFRQGNFDGGVEAGVDRLIAVVNGEPLPAPDKQWERGRGGGNLLPVLFVVALIGGLVLRAIFGRLIGSLATGGVVAALAVMLTHVWPLAIGAGIIGFLFALLSGSSRGWVAGGGWGGGLGGGGGF